MPPGQGKALNKQRSPILYLALLVLAPFRIACLASVCPSQEICVSELHALVYRTGFAQLANNVPCAYAPYPSDKLMKNKANKQIIISGAKFRMR